MKTFGRISLVIGGLVLVVIVGLGIFLASIFRDIANVTVRSTTPDRGLPRHDVAELAPGDATLVYLDHSNGWFLLGDDAPDNLRVGIHGPRLGGLLTGLPHAPVYCTGRNGRAVWVSINGYRTEEYAFCNPRRMDLSELFPYGQPITVHNVFFTASTIADRAAEIDANPSEARLDWPQDVRPETHRLTIETPYIWVPSNGSGDPWFETETQLETLGLDFQVARRNPQNLVETDADDNPVASGPLVIDNDETYIFPDVRIERLRIILFGDEAALTAALDHPALDLEQQLAPFRDAGILDRFSTDRVAVQTHVDQSSMVNIADLAGPMPTLSDIEEISYLVSYYSRRN